jgi:hypothetical protein
MYFWRWNCLSSRHWVKFKTIKYMRLIHRRYINFILVNTLPYFDHQW